MTVSLVKPAEPQRSTWVIDFGPCVQATCPDCRHTGWCGIEGSRPTGRLVECLHCLYQFVTAI